MNVKYWVGCGSEFPEQMYFNEIDAMVSGHAYLALFDETGALVDELKLVDNAYTGDF